MIYLNRRLRLRLHRLTWHAARLLFTCNITYSSFFADCPRIKYSQLRMAAWRHGGMAFSLHLMRVPRGMVLFSFLSSLSSIAMLPDSGDKSPGEVLSKNGAREVDGLMSTYSCEHHAVWYVWYVWYVTVLPFKESRYLYVCSVRISLLVGLLSNQLNPPERPWIRWN